MTSSDVRRKAHRLIEAGNVRPDDRPGIWWVTGRRNIERRVQRTADDEVVYWQCSCEHGRYAGGRARCSHVIAAQIITGEEAS